jgi:septum formation protein
MTVPEIILASASPRRAALLKQIGLPFRTHPSALGDDGEAPLVGEGAEAYACRLARAKAEEVAARLRRGLVDRLLGKPRDRDEAQAFLLSLAGRTHRVISGLAVVDGTTGQAEVGAAVTGVTMRPFDAREASKYVATGEPMDKAGAYGIQGRGALLVEAIQGDYFNVVGLPLTLLAVLLGRFGIDPWTMDAADAPGFPSRRKRP